MIVDLLPTDDQQQIREAVAGAVARTLPVTRLHDATTHGAAAEIAAWDELAGQGLFGLGVAEADGGIGYTIAEEVTVARELGRGLISPVVLSTMLAAHVVSGDLLAGIAGGSIRVAFANPLAPVDFARGGAVEVQLLDAAGASHALLWSDDAAALFPLPTAGEPKEAVDDTVSIDRATIDLGRPAARQEGAAMARRAALLLSAYLAGNAEATLAMAVEYAKVREQFGQPIGGFQAIKHYCAEMARRAEAAVAQTNFATVDALGRTDQDLFEASCARLIANDAAVENGRFNVQIHGGMGFTYEADAHLFLKRALLVAAINSGERLEQMRIMASAGPE